jgi:hypothetical protein
LGHGGVRCDVPAEHRGPLVAVAGHGSEVTLLCVRHAMDWAESDLCRDVAANNSKASLGALSQWIAAESETAAS